MSVEKQEPLFKLNVSYLKTAEQSQKDHICSNLILYCITDSDLIAIVFLCIHGLQSDYSEEI